MSKFSIAGDPPPIPLVGETLINWLVWGFLPDFSLDMVDSTLNRTVLEVYDKKVQVKTCIWMWFLLLQYIPDNSNFQ